MMSKRCPKKAQNHQPYRVNIFHPIFSVVSGGRTAYYGPITPLGADQIVYQEDCTFWDSTTYILKDKGFDRKDGGSLKCACLRLCHRQIWQKLWHFTAIIWCNQIFQYHYPRRHLDWHSSTHRFIYDRMRLTYPLPSSIAVPSYEIAPYWHFHCHRLRGAIISNCSIYSSAVWRTSSSDPAVSKAPSCTTIQLTSTFLWFYNIFEGGGGCMKNSLSISNCHYILVSSYTSYFCLWEAYIFHCRGFSCHIRVRHMVNVQGVLTMKSPRQWQ